MPEIDILCLANSRKQSDRCIAGLRLDSVGGWVRPIGLYNDGALTSSNIRLEMGREPVPLDVLRIGFKSAAPKSYHPEDWLIDNTRWQLVERRILDEETIKLIDSHSTSGPAILGNTSASITPNEVALSTEPASLTVVQPSNLVWHVTTSPNGKRQLRVQFILGRMPYNLGLTDLAWERYLKDYEFGYYKADQVGLSISTQPLLLVSLTGPFKPNPQTEERCYKVVAGLLPQPIGGILVEAA